MCPFTVQTRRIFFIFNTAALLSLVMSCLLTPVAAQPAGQAPAVDTLQQEVATLRKRVAALERQLAVVLQHEAAPPAVHAAAPSGKPPPTAMAPPAADAITNIIPVTSSEHSAVTVGGRLKIDAIYNSRSSGGNSGSNSGDLTFYPASIPLTGSGERNQISFSARETRLWLKGYSPSDYGEMAGYLEIDFSSATAASNEKVSNSFIPRLRHAYGTLGGFTLGQTFTTFMNVSAYPEVNDLNGPVGIMNIRQPLFRYRFRETWGNLYIALENPETTLATTAGNRIAPDDDRVPDLVGKVEFIGAWGNWSVAGMAREIRSDGTVLAGVADSAWGGAVSISGRLTLTSQDNLRFNLSYGNALGRYLSYNAYDDGVIDGNGRIHLTRIAGGYLAYQHWWTETLRSTAAAGFAHADNPSIVVPGGVNKDFYSTHLNLIWSPSLNASIGIEWLHAYRELEDGRNGRLDRVQVTSMYKF